MIIIKYLTLNKMKCFLSAGLFATALAFGLSSCENENINPYDYAAKTDTITINTGDENTVKTEQPLILPAPLSGATTPHL